MLLPCTQTLSGLLQSYFLLSQTLCMSNVEIIVINRAFAPQQQKVNALFITIISKLRYDIFIIAAFTLLTFSKKYKTLRLSYTDLLRGLVMVQNVHKVIKSLPVFASCG